MVVASMMKMEMKMMVTMKLWSLSTSTGQVRFGTMTYSRFWSDL
jgi:hypothetical protein